MITLQFSTTAGPLSWLARVFTWSDFSHVDVVMPDRQHLLGAQKEGVRIRPPRYQKFSRTARFNVFLPADQERQVWTFLYDQIGKPFDFFGLFAFPFRRNWQSEDRWFCSELVAAAFQAAGVPLVREQKNRVTPRDLVISPLVLPADLEASALKSALHGYAPQS